MTEKSEEIDVGVNVTDREVQIFLKQDLSWIPSVLTEFRLILREMPTTEGMGGRDCAENALARLNQLGNADPNLQHERLIATLALMYTSAGLRLESANSDLRKALYLLRPIANLKGGPKHPNWHLGVLAIRIASYHLRVLGGRRVGSPELMEQLTRLCWPSHEILPGFEELNLARWVATATSCYPSTREQLRGEWELLEETYRKRKTFGDHYYRVGTIYLGIKKRGLPRLKERTQGEKIFALSRTLLLWVGLATACILAWPYAKTIVLIVVGLSVIFWSARAYNLLRS